MVFSRVTGRLGVFAVVSLIIGVIVSVGLLAAMAALGIADRLQAIHLHEIFARTALAVVVVILLIAVLRSPDIPRRGAYGSNVRVLLAIYGVGVAAALLDPFNAIRNEMNVIRYPTAIVLTVAGVLLVRAALAARRHLVLRLAAGGLGLVLVAAAADEILQLHENLNKTGDTSLSQATGLETQDLATLLVAMSGIVIAWLVRRVIRNLAARGTFGLGGREVAASDLFLAAGIAFLAAMMLDSFDTVVSSLTRAGLSPFLGQDHALMQGLSLHAYVETLANSLEEFLEFGSAVLLLATAIVFGSDDA